MESSFKLLISSPLELNMKDNDDRTINEALQTIYPYTKESSVYMKWNNYILELNLAAQIADIYSDIASMLHLLNNKNNKKFCIHWGSSSFMAQWHFERLHDNMVNIKSFWTSVGGNERIKEIRKVSDTVTVHEVSFVNEWIDLLEIIRKDLLKSGYKDDLQDFNELQSLLKVYNR